LLKFSKERGLPHEYLLPLLFLSCNKMYYKKGCSQLLPLFSPISGVLYCHLFEKHYTNTFP
jgi:hypothetical protein